MERDENQGLCAQGVERRASLKLECGEEGALKQGFKEQMWFYQRESIGLEDLCTEFVFIARHRKKPVWSRDSLRTCTGYEGQVYRFSIAV